MKQLMKKYQGMTVEDDGAWMSTEAKAFVRAVRNALKREFANTSIEVLSCKSGHYFLSGFLKMENQYIYFSYNIPRCEMPIDLTATGCTNGILYRAAQNDHDYKGGINHFTSFQKLKSDVLCLLNS